MPTTAAPTKPPSSRPSTWAPTRPATTASSPASTTQGASRSSALRMTVKARPASTALSAKVHSGQRPRSAPACGGPATTSARRLPSATPKMMPRKVMPAPARRAVPEARWRVESSRMAMVSMKPGMSTMSPASVAVVVANGIQIDAQHASDEARSACGDGLVDLAQRLHLAGEEGEQAGDDADDDADTDLAQAAAEEARDGTGGERERGHHEHVAVRRWRRLDLIDAREAGLGRHGAAHDVGDDPVEPREVGQADRAGLDAQEMGLLVAEGPECGVDGGGRGEDLGQRQAQLLGEPGHGALEAAGGEPGAVERAAHAEHELDGVGRQRCG